MTIVTRLGLKQSAGCWRPQWLPWSHSGPSSPSTGRWDRVRRCVGSYKARRRSPPWISATWSGRRTTGVPHWHATSAGRTSLRAASTGSTQYLACCVAGQHSGLTPVALCHITRDTALSMKPRSTATHPPTTCISDTDSALGTVLCLNCRIKSGGDPLLFPPLSAPLLSFLSSFLLFPSLFIYSFNLRFSYLPFLSFLPPFPVFFLFSFHFHYGSGVSMFPPTI